MSYSEDEEDPLPTIITTEVSKYYNINTKWNRILSQKLSEFDKVGLGFDIKWLLVVCGCGKYLSTELESAARTIHNYYTG